MKQIKTISARLIRLLVIGFIIVPLVLIPSFVFALVVALISLVWSK